jgi:Tat protein translocase TatB subunit
VFSVSPAEIITILLIALVVFGPKRLPEMSRKAGKALKELRSTAQELRDGIERELEDSDLGKVRRELGATLGDLDEGLPPGETEDASPDTPRTPE